MKKFILGMFGLLLLSGNAYAAGCIADYNNKDYKRAISSCLIISNYGLSDRGSDRSHLILSQIYEYVQEPGMKPNYILAYKHFKNVVGKLYDDEIAF